MTSFLGAICRGIDTLNNRVGQFVSWRTALVVVVVFVELPLRDGNSERLNDLFIREQETRRLNLRLYSQR